MFRVLDGPFFDGVADAGGCSLSVGGFGGFSNASSGGVLEMYPKSLALKRCLWTVIGKTKSSGIKREMELACLHWNPMLAVINVASL